MCVCVPHGKATSSSPPSGSSSVLVRGKFYDDVFFTFFHFKSNVT